MAGSSIQILHTPLTPMKTVTALLTETPVPSRASIRRRRFLITSRATQVLTYTHWDASRSSFSPALLDPRTLETFDVIPNPWTTSIGLLIPGYHPNESFRYQVSSNGQQRVTPQKGCALCTQQVSCSKYLGFAVRTAHRRLSQLGKSVSKLVRVSIYTIARRCRPKLT
jgi:hypothetical protein